MSENVLESPPEGMTATLLKVVELQRERSQKLRLEPIRERKKRLIQIQNWIMSHREQIKDAVYRDFGKPRMEIDTNEIYPVLVEIRHTLAGLDRWAKPSKVDAPLTYLGSRASIVYEPKGVCLIISPWNFPFNLCMGPLVSCLAAGNTAVIKPSELTPSTSALVADMIRELFEPSLVHVVEGDAQVSTQLLNLPFDHIFFTGSPAVGKIVMRAAARHLASVTLELGGKSPAIVDQTANLKDAARRIAFGKFLNNGQTCIAPDYLLVHAAVHEPFVALLKQAVAELFGNGEVVDEKSSSYARVVNTKHFDRLVQLLQDAVKKGAQAVLSGPLNRETRFLHPTILTEVTADAELMEEEIFGPILPIIKFAHVEEVIQQVLSRPKPLALYIFSSNKSFRRQILSQTSAGGVCINDCVIQFSHPNLPFGGINNSGTGSAHGIYGFKTFSHEKPVLIQKNGLTIVYLLYPPYRDKMRHLVNIILRWF